MVVVDRLIHYTNIDTLPKGALIAAIVAISIFVLTKLFELGNKLNNDRAHKKRIVKALYREIQSNLVTLCAYTDNFKMVHELSEKVRNNPSLVPVSIIDETTQFYDSLGTSLIEVRSDSLISVTNFYAQLRQQREIVDAINKPAYLTISPEGRANMITNLWNSARLAEREGRSALYELRLSYPRHWFRDFKSRI